MVIKKDQPIMTLLIAFFLVLAFIAIFTHFCASEVKGQTPPMNPVNMDWSIDPLGIYLNTLDTYRVLQQYNAKIDTLVTEIDTLRLRIDSIQTSRDSIFYAYDAAGALSISPSSLDTITFDTEVREDAIFVHGADKGAVACNSAGWYNVVYSVGLRNSGGSALGAVYTYLIKYNAGWAAISGSYAYGTVSASANSAEQLGAKVDIELVSGDSLAVIAYNGNAADAAVTIAHTVRLRIEKLH